METYQLILGTIIAFTGLTVALKKKAFSVWVSYFEQGNLYLKKKDPYWLFSKMFITIFIIAFLFMAFILFNFGYKYNLLRNSQFYMESIPYLLKLLAMIFITHLLFKGADKLRKKMKW